MNRPIRTRTEPDEMRGRILEVAEKHFRRIGYHKTSVADIASELGMSRANVYRFFPSRDAINETICRRVVNEVADIAFAIARTNATASDKLDRLLTAIHQHNKTKLIKERRMHDLIVAALQEKRAIITAYVEWMVTVFEAIIREGIEAGEFKVDDPAGAARAVRTAFTPFFHPILIEHCVQHGEDTEAGLRKQIRFILKALGKSD
ncbi:MAG: TetR/AcrR family transcriptional regulator [Mesorhizobium sp.]|nr:TetR family transcriptional regulator [Mesorhizobium sp.]RWK61304.1 MAG: TetR/AcrR family transcriptional regulator [Mesorhizobium sp.]RWM45276.1 MAG: TetR/AcrR family transcriptional regulator [Mesorhizobium sp.]RWM50965.1 MAG: TetR/AcrR family transcriptional regulator [Mesorhizobium sp.]RWM51249.1 MAG: TetR/AcrR family transcriptional regulator [Mesorhizobium sp.]RWM96729.1 MAG: TetR/AcrR family transcriptional regulator [Mesorhizobium sp.]